MKYTLLVAVAVICLLLAIPLTHLPTDTQQKSHLKHLTTSKGSVDNSVVNYKTAATIKPENQQSKSASTTAPQTAKTVTVPTPAPVVTPAPAAAPTVTTASFKCQDYAADFEQYSWNAQTAMAICQAESSGNSGAISNANINVDGIPDYGLMQLHGIDILDPAQNISYAYYHKYLTQGWGAWSTYTSGKYLQFL